MHVQKIKHLLWKLENTRFKIMSLFEKNYLNNYAE